MKTITKYTYLLKTLNQNRTAYSKVKLQIPDEEYNSLYGITPTPTPNPGTYTYTYSYSYTYSYTYAYNGKR